MRRAGSARRCAAFARASQLPPAMCAARPRRYGRRWSVRSSARPEPGRGRHRRFRYPAARGRADRAAAPTAFAARRATRLPTRTTTSSPSSDFETGRALFPGAAFVAEAGDQMVVDDAGGLHESVDDGRADEFEPARGQFFRHLDRYRGRGRYAGGRFEVIDLRPAVDEIPNEFREAGAVFHDLQIRLRAVDGALDLGAVADDAGIVHQRVNFLFVIARDL